MTMELSCPSLRPMVSSSGSDTSWEGRGGDSVWEASRQRGQWPGGGMAMAKKEKGGVGQVGRQGREGHLGQTRSLRANGLDGYLG
jgi:hypothetical protein